MNTPVAVPDVSACILNLQARDLLRDCVQSLIQTTHCALQVIVVDNGSNDGSQAMLAQEFPQVQLVQNATNQGFTRASNQAMQLGQGRYLMLLNNDTLILPEAIDRLVAYMDANPQVGIVGPKVLNRDRTLQKPCRRGEPRPWAVICYFSGLAARYPQDARFSQYLQTHLPEDETNPVDGLSGSCMLIRREVVQQIGYLDERFFAYQEDADYCRMARDAGWQVVYMPQAQIIHYGGMGGSRVQPYRSIYQWHRSYFLYYRKHLAREYNPLFNGFYYLLMGGKLILALARNLFTTRKGLPGGNPPPAAS